MDTFSKEEIEIPKKYLDYLVDVGLLLSEDQESGETIYSFHDDLKTKTIEMIISKYLSKIESKVHLDYYYGFVNSLKIAISYARMPLVDQSFIKNLESMMKIPSMRKDVAMAIVEEGLMDPSVMSTFEFSKVYEMVINHIEMDSIDLYDVQTAIWNAYVSACFKKKFGLGIHDSTPPYIYKPGPYIYKPGPYIYKPGPWILSEPK